MNDDDRFVFCSEAVEPDRTFYNFTASKSVNRRIIRSSETVLKLLNRAMFSREAEKVVEKRSVYDNDLSCKSCEGGKGEGNCKKKEEEAPLPAAVAAADAAQLAVGR